MMFWKVKAFPESRGSVKLQFISVFINVVKNVRSCGECSVDD